MLLQIGEAVALHQHRLAVLDHRDLEARALARGDGGRRQFIDRCGEILVVGRLRLCSGP